MFLNNIRAKEILSGVQLFRKKVKVNRPNIQYKAILILNKFQYIQMTKTINIPTGQINIKIYTWPEIKAFMCLKK